jgi:hypothetical protein
MSDEPPVKVMELFPFASFTFVEADRYLPLVPGKLIRSCKIRFTVTATVAVSQSWHISEDTIPWPLCKDLDVVIVVETAPKPARFINMVACSSIYSVKRIGPSNRLNEFCQDISRSRNSVSKMSLKSGLPVVVHILNARVWNINKRDILEQECLSPE